MPTAYRPEFDTEDLLWGIKDFMVDDFSTVLSTISAYKNDGITLEEIPDENFFVIDAPGGEVSERGPFMMIDITRPVDAEPCGDALLEKIEILISVFHPGLMQHPTEQINRSLLRYSKAVQMVLKANFIPNKFPGLTVAKIGSIEYPLKKDETGELMGASFTTVNCFLA